MRKARTGEVTGSDVLTVHCHVYDIITLQHITTVIQQNKE